MPCILIDFHWNCIRYFRAQSPMNPLDERDNLTTNNKPQPNGLIQKINENLFFCALLLSLNWTGEFDQDFFCSLCFSCTQRFFSNHPSSDLFCVCVYPLRRKKKRYRRANVTCKNYIFFIYEHKSLESENSSIEWWKYHKTLCAIYFRMNANVRSAWERRQKANWKKNVWSHIGDWSVLSIKAFSDRFFFASLLMNLQYVRTCRLIRILNGVWMKK